MLYVIPFILVSLLEWQTNYSLNWLLVIYNNIVGVPSIIYHTIRYMGIVEIVSVYCRRRESALYLPILEKFSLGIIMTLYQFVIDITRYIINYVLRENFYWMSISLNLIILLLCYSFYLHNYLWQYQVYKLQNRIDFCQRLWPYYFGYGLIPSIIYFYTDHPMVLALYNFYMAIVISLTFILPPKYPIQNQSYVNLNLSIFSHLTTIFVETIKLLIRLIPGKTKSGSNPNQS